MVEDVFVEQALNVATALLKPPLTIRRGAALLYQVTVSNRLEMSVDLRNPVRGQSAFETDLCVFEQVDERVSIPRVVMEFKSGVTTHDVLTYSTKARKHKQVYPYLRYGMVVSRESTIPGRVFRHNDALDFVLAAAGLRETQLHEAFAALIEKELAASRVLEAIAFDSLKVRSYRLEPVTLRDAPEST